MKILASLIALTFTLNAFASQRSVKLQDIVNDYEYAVTVEWDQIDKDFFNQQNEKFSLALDDLFEQGLTSEDVFQAYPTAKLNFPTTLTRQTLTDWMKDQSHFARGANWNGTAVLFYGGVGAVFIGFIAYSVWYSNNYECESWIPSGPRNTCSRWVRK